MKKSEIRILESKQGTDASTQALTSFLSQEPRLAPVVLQFVENLTGRLTRLTAAMRQTEWDSLRQEAHKLAGAENFGFPDLGCLAKSLENAASEHSEMASQRLISEIQAKVTRIQSLQCELQSWVGGERGLDD